MAWYRIAGNALDAIANAINAKTGKTAPMTPVEMVLEIQSIQTGGGSTPTLHKIAEYTISEAVNSIVIPIPTVMNKRGGLYIKLIDVTFNDPYLYFGIGARSEIYYPSSTIGTAVDGVYTFNQLFTAAWCAQANISASETTDGIQSYARTSGTNADRKSGNLANVTAETIGLYPYTSSHQFLSGTIEIWGVS